MGEEVYDVVIVGGAAAALSASIYAVRSGMSVKLVTDSFGGQINNTDVVENYLGIKSISGPDLVDEYREHMREYDVDEEVGYKVESIEKNSDDVFEVKDTQGNIYNGFSVIMATGGSRRKLNAPGEEDYLNKGVAYCAVCDGPLYKGEEVAVIGGGYAGTEAAEYLSDIAEKVYLLSRSGELSGEAITINKVLEEDNIEILRGASTKRFEGSQFLEHVIYEMDGEEKELEVEAAFIEIGTVPNSDISNAEKNDSGYVKIDDDMHTSIEGLYAAGDVTDKGAQQLVVSAGQGCQAALKASEYVKTVKSENQKN